MNVDLGYDVFRSYLHGNEKGEPIDAMSGRESIAPKKQKLDV